MSVKVEAGKYYRKRSGIRVGPMDEGWCGLIKGNATIYKASSGRVFHSSSVESPDDIIAEWTDEPESEWGEWTADRDEWIKMKVDVHVQCEFKGGTYLRHRVRKEPVREAARFVGHWDHETRSFCFSKGGPKDFPVIITFDVIDGKPDWSSIRAESDS